jgi:hypothetical protein
LIGIHREKKEGYTKNYQDENSHSRTTRAKRVLERGETNGKKESSRAKICDGPMFQLGTTGSDDDDNDDLPNDIWA